MCRTPRACANAGSSLEGLGPVSGTRVTCHAVGGRRSDTAALASRVVLGALYWVVKWEDRLLLIILSLAEVLESGLCFLFKLDLPAAGLTCIFLSGCVNGAVS